MAVATNAEGAATLFFALTIYATAKISAFMAIRRRHATYAIRVAKRKMRFGEI